MSYASLVQYEEFQLYYFEVFSKVDSIVSETIVEESKKQLIIEDFMVDDIVIKKKKTQDGYNQLVQESLSHADDLANPIDSSSFLFEKLNNSKENSQLMK